MKQGGRPSKVGYNNTYYADTLIANDVIGRLTMASAPNQTRPWFVAVASWVSKYYICRQNRAFSAGIA